MKLWPLFFLLIECLVNCSPLEKPYSTTVCEITKSPEVFANRIVKLSGGYVDSDGFEWVLLSDNRCPTSGINLEFAESFSRSDPAKRLIKIVFETKPWGTAYKDIRANFTGSVDWEPESNDRHKRLRLVVTGIEDLKFVPLKKKRLSPFSELR